MKFGHHYFVYILECSDKSYYTGVTNNLKGRLAQHQDGDITTCYTFKRRPVLLKYSTHLTDIKQAIAWEKQIKGWSRKERSRRLGNHYKTCKKLYSISA